MWNSWWQGWHKGSYFPIFMFLEEITQTMFPCFWKELMLLIAQILSSGPGLSPHLNQRSVCAHAQGWGASWSDPSMETSIKAPESCKSFSGLFRTQVRENRFEISSKWNIGHPEVMFLNPWPTGCLVSHPCTHLPSHLCTAYYFSSPYLP